MLEVKKASIRSRRHRFYLLLPYILIGFGLVAGSFALTLYIEQKSATTPPPIPQITAPKETQAPAKVVKPTAKEVAEYQVASTLPKYLSIPAIGVDKVRILSLGVDKNNEIAVPTTAYDTGWYKDSAKPGDSGAMFIYGHVAGWGGGGVFYNLKNLKSGEKITVTRGDNKVFTYQVDSLEVYPADNVDMNAVLSPIDPVKPGLNLMTCVWTVVNGKSEFNSRQVVFASLVN